MYYIGIDPGVSGGIAVIDSKRKVLEATGMPESMSDVWEFLAGWILPTVPTGTPARVTIEKVTGYIPGRSSKRKEYEQTGNAQPGHAMFRFGTSYGALLMGVTATGLRQDSEWWNVTPQVWQRSLGLRTRFKGEADNSWKNYLKSTALTLFPEVKVTLKTADALLLAEYTWRYMNGS